ncbi:MAG: hypothetical protein IH959_06940 [Chloroflexi bacterium]|nr:hypothetical protein [Chloroflexota bacterium]
MKAVAKNRQQVDRMDDGVWLSRLLADVRSEMWRQPSPQAIARIRGRVMAQVRAPLRAAA